MPWGPTSRNIKSTVGSQDEVTTAAIILDAYRALEVLANHPKIDKNKVSITGWSLGGAVALFSGWMPIKKAINNNLKFASHLAFYPPCFFDPENTDFTDSPIHILIGEFDNWTPAQPCVNFVKKISKNSNVKLTIYPNSHHSSGRHLLLLPSEAHPMGRNSCWCRRCIDNLELTPS